MQDSFGQRRSQQYKDGVHNFIFAAFLTCLYLCLIAVSSGLSEAKHEAARRKRLIAKKMHRKSGTFISTVMLTGKKAFAGFSGVLPAQPFHQHACA
jgi:hypothetical protein